MNYTTFNGKIKNIFEIDHQHLSNIYWYSRILNKSSLPLVISNRIEGEFNNKILQYRPNPLFKTEIDRLDKMGLLDWNEEHTIANIHFEGQIIGQAKYIDAHRDTLIEDIIW